MAHIKTVYDAVKFSIGFEKKPALLPETSIHREREKGR
jgi:hypothetical protein